MYFSGFIYLQEAGVEPEIVYSAFPELKYLDIFYGLILIAVGCVYQFIARRKLVNFEKEAPEFFIFFAIVVGLVEIIYLAVQCAIVGFYVDDVISSILGIIIGNAVYIYLNYRYFQKKIDEFLHSYPGYFSYLPARILNNCILLPIEADNQNTALRIFSTLNDRGLPLSDADIFKAQFYKYYSDKGQKESFIKMNEL